MEQDFNIKIAGVDASSLPLEDSSATLTPEQIETAYQKKLKEALEFTPSDRSMSVFLKDDTTESNIDYTVLDNLSQSPQSDLSKTMRIANLARQYVTKDDIIGVAYEAIVHNVNHEIRLSYKRAKKGVRNKSDIEAVKELINAFNEQINLPAFISRAIPTTWCDGNFYAYLRQKDKKDGTFDYSVDYYPLGVAYASDYEVGGEPILVMDVQELKSRLQKTYPRTKKRKGLFYDNALQEVEDTYPKEVVDAYKAGEQLAKLPVEYTCVARINNLNKKFGISAVFKALYDVLMLEAFAKADRMTAKSRSKKIIAQYLRKETLGPDFTRNSFDAQTYNHKGLVDAWKQPIVIYTPDARVDNISYIEPSAEMTNIDIMQFYRQREYNSLGIGFLLDGGSQSLSVANISLKQLLRTIGAISKQIENTLGKWYKIVLQNAGMDINLAPTINILDSEMLEMSMKIQLATTLYNTFNVSRESALDILGFDVNDEWTKREYENKQNLDEVFAPRQTNFTTNGGGGSSGGKGGRPTNDNEDNPEKKQKTDYDKTRYEQLKDAK